MGERSHLSIGEVLALVQEEFPDVTISKIRFLESQGLLDPERTPSGYRKFYPSDIERLQWILTQQRDKFLPLKIIRERLDEWDQTGAAPEDDHPPTSTEEPPVTDDEQDPGADVRHAAAALAAATADEVVHPPSPELVGAPPPSTEAPEPTDDTVVATAPAPGHGQSPPLRVGPDDTALTASELADRAGVDVKVVLELENYSMIESRRVGPESYFAPEHLEVVQASKAFLDHGIEVRHLRMYKIAAEREAGVFEQLVMPLLKQRNPEARARAVDLVGALAEVGEELHRALLRQIMARTLP